MMLYSLEREGAIFEKSYSTDAGYDLAVISKTTIEPLGKALVDSGVRVAIPEGNFGLLLGRSSLSTKLNSHLVTGVIDSEYRGNILMNIVNDDEHYPRILKEGTRVAQLVVMPLSTEEALQVTKLHHSTTKRGRGGFGSTD